MKNLKKVLNYKKLSIHAIFIINIVLLGVISLETEFKSGLNYI